MAPVTSIKYIPYHQIDKLKWDACIDKACNGLVYAYSWYLDNMARHWDALILDDYTTIMPLTWNKKWGIRYLYQPPFTPQLGIFSVSVVTPAIVEAFLEQANRRFRFTEIFLNYANACPGLPKHTNYVLSLNTSCADLINGYHKNHLKNLKRSARFRPEYIKNADLNTVLRLYRQTYGNRIPHVTSNDYAHFKKLCTYAQQQGYAIVRSVITPQQELLAACLLLHKNNRLYLLQSITTAKGRKTEANYFLLDQVIQEFCEQELLLDFEGSDIESIAYFYKNFGGRLEPYFFYRNNRLPWLVKLFK